MIQSIDIGPLDQLVPKALQSEPAVPVDPAVGTETEGDNVDPGPSGRFLRVVQKPQLRRITLPNDKWDHWVVILGRSLKTQLLIQLPLKQPGERLGFFDGSTSIAT